MRLSQSLPTPKLCGADIELGNFMLGVADLAGRGTGPMAARRLLAEIDGIRSCGAGGYENTASTQGSGSAPGYHPMDWGRKFLVNNGGCAYIDLDHLEVCIPEVLSAFDHVAATRSLFRIARKAMQDANQKLPPGESLQILANNSDGQGHSYGSHLSFLLARRTWEDLFQRRLHYLLFLASYQASSIVFTGQGKVGSENGASPVRYQISQRADFVEQLQALQTTFERPLVNTRDESLAWPRERCARLHVIFYDNTLCQVASLLKVGVMQIILAMLESGRVSRDSFLEDPVEAVRSWSHDPDLKRRQRLLDGRELTAVEHQRMVFTQASDFVASGACGDAVPRVQEILALWGDTLTKLECRDFTGLASRIDWVLKQVILEHALAENPNLSWEDAAMKQLDLHYANLDVTQGLFWPYEENGFAERVASENRIRHLVDHPPEDTRAYARAHLLRMAVERGATVKSMDWDWLSIAYPANGFIHADSGMVRMDDPLGFTRAYFDFDDCADFESAMDHFARSIPPDTECDHETQGGRPPERARQPPNPADGNQTQTRA